MLDRLADLLHDGVETQADREKVEQASAAIGELENGLDGAVNGSPDAALRGSLLLAARQLLHDLASLTGFYAATSSVAARWRAGG